MRVIKVEVAGEPCTGYFANQPTDLPKFIEWVKERARRNDVVACDSEATDLAIFSPGFRVRLVQFGTPREGWLIPVEYGTAWEDVVTDALGRLPRLTFQNFPFDGLAFDRFQYAPLEVLARKTIDTKILAHLIDSRPEAEGGIGTSLKPLSVHYIDPTADDGQKELLREFHAIGQTKTTGWAHIALDNPVYLKYALMDVLLGSRLLPILQARCRELGISPRLAEYEHQIALIGAKIQRKGMLIDPVYTARLRDELLEEREYFAGVARRYGVESVNAPKQVAAALSAMGEEWSEKTATGAPAVGKEVLLPMADLDKGWRRIGAREPNPLADAVLRSKRAGKWAVSYAEAMLDLRDGDDILHPHINTMGARTARWSYSSPPLQQLPSSEWRVRRCVVARPGNLIVASDFAQVELRVLAGLAGATAVCERINRGEDLHTLTTRMVFGIGPEVSDAELKDDPRRKLTKVISLGTAYGGGITALSRQTGLPVEQIKQAKAQYDRALPEFKRYAARLTREAYANGMTVTTASGRLLRLNRDKTYTAIAYMCQSTARDVLGQALIDMESRGLLDHVIGVVHDEVLGDVPAEDAEDYAREMGECMTFPKAFGLVDIESDPEVYGPSWGHGYAKAEDEKAALAATMKEAK
jgi:DNA polymerase-1